MSAYPTHCDRAAEYPGRPTRAVHGFTLIELLVVISIIALLVGILLPALGAARRTAVILKCTTQIRQIGLGNAAFETDNGYVVPMWEEGRGWQWASNTWKEILRDEGYVPVEEGFLCPIVAEEGDLRDETGDDPSKIGPPYTNYRINRQIAGAGFVDGIDEIPQPLSSDAVTRTSNTFMFMDHRVASGFRSGISLVFNDWGHLDLAHIQALGNGWYFSKWGPMKIASGSASYAMVDGSATTLTFTMDKQPKDFERFSFGGAEEYYLTPDSDW